ncbi:MAG: HEAT repeat domain-containing protein [Ignavibacteria bacterium]|nr:HEAT repeat domain-containing protein [Ignavibacteria bacterium]
MNENNSLNALIGIFTTDTEFNILSWNSVMEVFSGIPEEKIKGKNLFEIFPEIVNNKLDKKYRNVIETGQVEFISSVFHNYLLKFKPLNMNSQFEWMLQSASISPLFDGTRIVGTITTIKDVTHIREKDDALTSPKKVNKLEAHEKNQLIENLQNEDWRVRKEAVEILKHSSSEILEEILIKIKNSHKNLNILNSALQVLLGHTEKVTDTLHDLIKSHDKDLRIYAAQTLGEVKDKKAIPILIEALNDPNQNVVYHAIESLGKLKAYDAVDKLIDIALKEDFFLSFAAIDALKNMGEKIILIHTHKLINRDVFHPLLIEILRDIGDDSAVPQLIELLKNSPPNIFDIAEALICIYNRYEKQFGEGKYILSTINHYLDQSSIKNLLDALHNQKHPKFIYLIQLLTLIGNEEILKSIFNYLKDSTLRKIIVKALLIREDNAAKLLFEKIDQLDFDSKIEMLKVAGNFSSPEIVSVLKNYLDDEDEEILVTTLNSLARIGSADAYHKILELLKHPSPVVRRSAIAALNSIGHPNMSKDIHKLLYSENYNELDSAIRIAGYFGFTNCTDRMIELCSHENENIRATALENIGIFEAKGIIDILENALQKDSPKCRIAAVKSLTFVPDNKIYELIIEALSDENFWVRVNAIRAIQFLRYTPASNYLINLLENEKTIPVIISALIALGELGSENAISTITNFINHENPDVSLAAIEALGNIKSPNSVQPLIELLSSASSKMRLKSLESIKKLKFDSTIEIIKYFTLKETDEEIKKQAIVALGEFQSEQSVRALIDLTKNFEIRELCIEQLAKQNPKLLYIFEKSLNEEAIPVRLALIEALTLMRNEEATNLIIQSLDDENAIVRVYAINSLKRLGSREAIKKINYLSKNDSNEQVRITAQNFLEKLS